MSRPVAKAQSYMDISNMLVSLEQKKKRQKETKNGTHKIFKLYGWNEMENAAKKLKRVELCGFVRLRHIVYNVEEQTYLAIFEYCTFRARKKSHGNTKTNEEFKRMDCLSIAGL